MANRVEKDKNSTGEKVVLYITFIIAVMSFLYSVFYAYKKHVSINSLVILSNKTDQSYVKVNDYNQLSSNFAFSNTGNRKIYIIDAWLTAEIDEKHVNDLKSHGKYSEAVKKYTMLFKAGVFSRESSK